MKNIQYSMRRILLTARVILLFGNVLFGQIDLPKIVLPAPATAALFKFQDYPMDHSTGLPQINIPIYEVKSGSLSVPISISNHASGRKVYDQDGPVGLGWSLNAGGMISRTISGSADFGTPVTGVFKFPYPFRFADELNNINITNLQYFEKIMHFAGEGDFGSGSFLDSEYDIFSYSCNGLSGKFIFKDVNNVKTPVLLPYKPYIITPIFTMNELSEIEITDDNGVLYKFSGNERYTTGSNNALSGWVLSKIISADKTDTVTFVYTAKSEERITISQQAVLIDKWVTSYPELYPFPSENLTYPENTSHEIYQTSRLTEIKFKQGKVLFNLVVGSDKIDNIQIIDINNQVLKTVQFSRSLCYSQSELGTATNKLDAIVFKDKANTAVESYSFEYYPLVSSNGQLNPRYCDWWGYYNNSGMHDFVPRYTNLTYMGSGGPGTIDIGNPSANREPNLEPMKTGVLKKIIYPTGGSTEFLYEYNKCTLNGSPTSPRNGPGLRVYEINSADNNGTIIKRMYKYGVNESGYGAIELLPQMNVMSKEETYNNINPIAFGTTCLDPDSGPSSYRQRSFNSGFLPEFGELAGRPVIYTEVAEYHGSLTSNIGKTVYKYNTDYAIWSPQAMRVFEQAAIYKMHVYDFNYWNTPSVILKTDYKRINAAYQKVKETTYNYLSTVTEYVKGLHVQRVHNYPQTGRECGTGYYAEKYGTAIQSVPVYTFSDYRIPVGYKNLTSTGETIYTENNTPISNGIAYQYNSRQMVSKKTTATSEGSSIVSDIKYAFDYSGNSVLTQMVNLNMLNFPIEQIETKGLIPTKSVRTNYFNWGTTPARIAPQTVELKIGSGLYETRLRYSAYDADANPLTVSKENDLLISYVWGYNNTYPIAEVTNAAVKNVFHTSFEDANGNSIVNDCKTGRRSRTGGFSKPLSNLDNGSYILSYWQKSGVNWLRQSSVVSVTSGAYNISLTGQVDEVRFYPKSSLIKTFTYDPLIGVISECDPSDHISYYEYDDYGRLKLVRDMNGNILKTFKYKYQSTSTN